MYASRHRLHARVHQDTIIQDHGTPRTMPPIYQDSYTPESFSRVCSVGGNKDAAGSNQCHVGGHHLETLPASTGSKAEPVNLAERKTYIPDIGKHDVV